MPLRKLGPGSYVDDMTGTLHIEIPELLIANGFADTKANRETAEREAIAVAEEIGAEWTIVEHGKIVKRGGPPE